MNKKVLKKTIAVTTSVATTLSISGIALLMPVFVAASSHIMDGDVIKTASSPDVYIVKTMGSKMFKRLILNPEVFESYGHLTWDMVKTVSDSDMAVYTVTDLVRAEGDPKVYRLTSAPNSDVGEKSWVNMTATEFVAAGYDWDAIYQINTTDRDNYTATSDTTVTPPPTTTGVTLSLSSDSPAAGSVAMGATDVVFTKIDFVGGENTTISAISVTRSGLANDSDLSDVKLWDGSTQLDSTQAINSTTHKAVFTGLSWVVPAGTTKVLTITGSIAGTGTAATSTQPKLGIAAAADITADKEIKGTFPIAGGGMTIAGIVIGRLDVVARSVPGDNQPISGSTEQEIASFQFSAVNEGMSVKKIMLTQVGSAANSDISNMKLKIAGAQVGSTVSALASNGTATFDLTSAPIEINLGANKIIYVYADIAAGITTARTVNFEITNTTDVTAIGSNSGGAVTITGSSGAAFSSATPTNVQTINQGVVLSITTNGATNPSAQTFVVGSSQVLISAFRFSNGAGEDQRVARLKLSLGGTNAGATDLSNVTLYQYDETAGTETQVGTPTSFVGTIATYGSNSTGLDTGVFDVAENKNVVIHVRADVSSAAVWDTNQLGIFINEAKIDGIKSAGDIGNATIGTVDIVTEVTQHSSATVGLLTMAVSPTTPAAQNVVPGTTGFEYLKVDFTMTLEAATLSSVTVDLCDGPICANEAGNVTAGSIAESGDMTNVKLWNGSTQLGTTQANPSTQATFSFNLTLPKDETVTLSVTADVPTNAVSIWLANSGATTTSMGIDRAITATGVSSSATVAIPINDARGNLITALIETLTVTFQTVPDTTLILNESSAILSKIVLTAGTAGDVKVSSIKFTAASTTNLNQGGDSTADTDIGSLKLYDGSTQIGSTLSGFTDAAGGDTATFTGLSITVTKGTSKVLELKGNILDASNNDIAVGVEDLTATVTDIVGTGLASNTTVYGTGTDGGQSGLITLAGAGTLTVKVDTNTALQRYVAVGGTAGKLGVDFSSFKFTATNESIEVETLVFRLEDNADTGNTDQNDVPNFAALKLYDGTTQVGGTFFPTATNTDLGVDITFNFNTSADELIITGSKILTIKADMNGTSNGANSTTTPRFFIVDVTGTTNGGSGGSDAASITARGVSSGARVESLPGSISAEDPETVGNFNEMIVVKGRPVFALCTAANCTKASPSGSLVPGVSEVFRFRITAEEADIVFDGTAANHNIRFTVSQSGGIYAGDRVMDFYEVGKSAARHSVTVSNATNTDVDFLYATTTIAKGTYKEYYINYDLQDYSSSGNTYRLTINNDTNDLSWGDGKTANITNSNVAEVGLPITGGTLTK